MEQKIRCRKYYDIPGLIVYEDGQKIERQYKQKDPNYPNYPTRLSIKIDDDGNKFVYTKDHGKLFVDRLVATCFCYRPQGADQVIHKDGNKQNCHKSNLEWKLVDLPDGTRPVGNGFSVSKEGKVLKDGKEVTILDYIYDPDMGAHQAVDPFFVNARSKHQSVDETIARAYLPEPYGIDNPKILHKDFDYQNCNVSNLEYIGGASQEYQSYLDARKQAIKKRNEELSIEFNGH